MSEQKVWQYIGLDRAKAGDVGLELEVEGAAPLPVVNEKSWRAKEDGSLRGFSMEYYSARPINVDHTLRDRIDYLCGLLAKEEYRVDRASPRTSLHVHVNVTNLTPTQVWTAVTCYWLLENALMKYCGHDREGNLFCLRLTDAEYALKTVIQDIKGTAPFNTVFSDRIRYMSQNLKAIQQFGSLEFRGMRGTIDPDVIETWVTQLHNLVQRSHQIWKSPADLMDSYFNGSDILKAVVDAPFQRTLHTLGNVSQLIEDNAGLLCELAYSTNWTKYQERIARNKPTLRVQEMARPAPRAAGMAGGANPIANAVNAWEEAQRILQQRAAPRPRPINNDGF